MDRQIGLEATVEAYLARLLAVFAEVRRVLRDDGLLAVNMGDSYGVGACGGGTVFSNGRTDGRNDQDTRQAKFAGGRDFLKARKANRELDAGNLLGVPWRFALAMQQAGWCWRSTVVWHKRAPMPASLAGWRWQRCRKPHYVAQRNQAKVAGIGDGRRQVPNGRPANKELTTYEDCPGCRKCEPNGGLVLRRGSWRPTPSWEPVFLFSKQMGYFADGEPVKTPAAPATVGRDRYTRILDDPDEQFAVRHDHETVCESGANLRDVWTLGPESLSDPHYAAYPTALVAQFLRFACSDRGVCGSCGAPVARVLSTRYVPHGDSAKAQNKTTFGERAGGDLEKGGFRPQEMPYGRASRVDDTLGWRPTCACSAPAVPSLVLDPFAGSGSTGVACRRLGLRFVGVDLSERYCGIARRRIEGALRRSKRAKADAQPDLFGEEAP